MLDESSYTVEEEKERRRNRRRRRRSNGEWTGGEWIPKRSYATETEATSDDRYRDKRSNVLNERSSRRNVRTSVCHETAIPDSSVNGEKFRIFLREKSQVSFTRAPDATRNFPLFSRETFLSSTNFEASFAVRCSIDGPSRGGFTFYTIIPIETVLERSSANA